MKKIARRVRSLVDQEEIYTESFTNSKDIKQTVVISHGMGGDSNATVPFIEELLQLIPHLRCITYDIRGHGYSTRHFPSSNTIEHIFVQDLSSIIQSYHLKKFTLLGHSLGGLISQEYIIQHTFPKPQSIILLSSFPKFPIPNMGRKFWMQILSRKSKKIRGKKKRTVDDHFQFYQSFDYSINRIFSDIQHTSLMLFFLMYLSLCGWKNTKSQLLDDEENLYIYGENDRVVLPTIQRMFCKNLSKIQQYKITSNHNSLFNSPGKVAEIIAKKLQYER